MSLRTWFKIIFIEPEKNAYDVWPFYSRMVPIALISIAFGCFLAIEEWVGVFILPIGIIAGIEGMRRNIKRHSIGKN